MATFLHDKFYKSIYRFIKTPASILVAISGGQDSICLVKLFKDLLEKKLLKIEAIYIDYQWQKDSKKHIEQIISFTKKINIRLSIYQISFPIFSEAQARKLRYQLLIEHALRYKYKYIFTAHTKNDRIETLLQNLFKGTTIDGATSLSTIKIVHKDLYIIRPLLNFERSELQWLCRHFYLPVWSDITNYNYNISRNRIRNELMNYLRSYFNPNIQDTLSNFLDITSRDNEYIKQNSIKLYIKAIHKELIALNLTTLKKQPIALQVRTTKIFFQYHFNKSIHNNIIKQILNLNLNKNKLFYTNQLIIQYKMPWLYANYIVK